MNDGTSFFKYLRERGIEMMDEMIDARVAVRQPNGLAGYNNPRIVSVVSHVQLCLVDITRSSKGGWLPMNTRANRRQAIIGAAGLAFVAGTSKAIGRTNDVHTCVLVHGAWHGGWCWRRVADILENRGHNVYRPTMTGLGERSHLLSKEINLTTHITDIVNVIEWENLNDIVLVAHSYGGIIASGVAEALHDRISSIVCFDTFLPENGETLLEKSSPAFVGAIKTAISNGDSGIKAPPATVFGVDAKDRGWVDAKTTPQPVGTYVEKAVYTGARDRIKKKTFVRLKGYKSATFDGNLAKANNSGWKTYELDLGHDVMVIDPQKTSEIILSAA